MAETEYLAVYKHFFLEFAATVNPDDQLPVKVAGYCICDNELHGEIVDWILQYLSQKRCPSTLIAPLAKIVLAEITEAIKRQPEDCGYRKDDKAYQPLKLMQAVTARVNDVCLRYLDPERLASLPPPLPELPTSVCSIKNTRRRMEDRHTVIDDFHSVFGVKDAGQATYYGVFDGHAGTDAAVYSVSHLHQFLAESQFYPAEPERALKDAFLRTDAMFLEKSERDNLRSGTTALCALLQHDRRMLYVAWLGDSQAVLVRRGVATQLVDPHKPSRHDERRRIEDMGGCVMFWGMWRVNGQLAVSRAIGDLEYKPYVSADADVLAIPIEDDQDFVILACDGLWDFVSEQQAAFCVYETIRAHPGDLEAVSASLVRLSKQQGSVDNISVIVAFLTPPDKLASLDVWPAADVDVDADAMDPALENGCLTPRTPEMHSNGTRGQTNGGDLAFQKASFQLELENGKCQPMSHADVDFLERPPADGKEDTFDEDDFGPETDVDALDGGADVDDVLMSPTIAAEKAAAAAVAAVADSSVSPKEQHLAAIEADLELQRQQLSVFDPVSEPREETPTPPADDVIGEVAVEPEADNVAESGDESEDEWNYYRVDPSEKKPSEAAVEADAQPTQSNQPADDEDDESMESRLNPNAAEFVPSPTSALPSMEEVLSGSPFKGKVTPMDNIVMPTALEFQREFHKRPSDLHEFANPFAAATVPDFGQNAPDFGQNAPDFGQNAPNFGQNVPDFGQNVPDFGQNVPDFSNVPDFGQNDFGQNDPLDVPDFVQTNAYETPDFLNGVANGNDSFAAKGAEFADFATQLQSFSHADHLLDKSEVSSTLAEFGDETSTSFGAEDLDRKDLVDLDASMTPSEFHNTVDLSTELQRSEGDASPPNKASPFSGIEPMSPNIESGIGMDDSPVPDFEELCLDPAPVSPALDVGATFRAEFDGSELMKPFIAVCPAYVAPEPELEVAQAAFKVAEPEFKGADSEFKVEEPELKPAEPEQKAAEPLSHADLEDFLSAAPAALTNGFAAEGHAEPAEVAAKPTAEPEGLLTEAVVASVAAAAAVATVAAVASKDAKKPAATDKAKPGAKPAPKAATSPTKPAPKRVAPAPASPAARPAPRMTATAKPAPKAAVPAPKAAVPAPKAPLVPRTKPATSPSTRTAASPLTKTAASPLAKSAASPTARAAPVKTALPPRAALVPKAAPKAMLADKKPLANGDAKPIAKRTEPLASRRPLPAAGATAKPAPRPATAPPRAARPATTTSTATRTTLAARTAPVANGVSKPRPATTLGAVRAKPAATAADKQVKETANKQISQTAGKTMTVTRTTTTTARRMAGVPMKATAVTTTTTSKSTGPIRRPAGTVGVKSTTTTTTTVKTVEGAVNGTSLDLPAVAEIDPVAATVVKDDSPVIADNNVAVVIGTD